MSSEQFLGISMKFSGKMRLMIITKVTKKAGLHPLSEKCISGKTTAGSNSVKYGIVLNMG